MRFNKPPYSSYIGNVFLMTRYGEQVRAKCVDIEFETGTGPLFLMKDVNSAQKFWLTRMEMREVEVY